MSTGFEHSVEVVGVCSLDERTLKGNGDLLVTAKVEQQRTDMFEACEGERNAIRSMIDNLKTKKNQEKIDPSSKMDVANHYKARLAHVIDFNKG
jgi:hypothetical protein